MFIKKIKKEIVDIKDDGSIFYKSRKYFNYTFGSKMINKKRFKNLFDLKPRKESDEIFQSHCNMALAIQKVIEEIVIEMVKEAKN